MPNLQNDLSNVPQGELGTNQELQPKKELWVSPVVRDYDPAEVTRAAPVGLGGDLGLYS